MKSKILIILDSTTLQSYFLKSQAEIYTISGMEMTNHYKKPTI